MADLHLGEEARAESEAMFAEAPAPDGVLLTSGARMVELPCGVEIEFVEPDENHVVIVQASWPSSPKIG
jgi:hypothetical protein